MTDQQGSPDAAVPDLIEAGAEGPPAGPSLLPAAILAVVAVLVALDIHMDWGDGATPSTSAWSSSR